MKTFLSLFIFMCLFSCSEPNPDLSQIDQLIQQKSYAEARALLLAEQKKTFKDTLQYARIRTRLQRIEVGSFFSEIQQSINHQNWSQADSLWRQNQIGLSNKKQDFTKYFYFSHFQLRAQIDSALNRPDSIIWFLQKSSNYPVFQKEELRQNYEKLAFCFAEEDSLIAARRYMDKSLRMARLSQMDSSLRELYFMYMNGKFEACRIGLTHIPDSLKTAQWKNLQLFLERFGAQLTLEERFKLW